MDGTATRANRRSVLHASDRCHLFPVAVTNRAPIIRPDDLFRLSTPLSGPCRTRGSYGTEKALGLTVIVNEVRVAVPDVLALGAPAYAKIPSFVKQYFHRIVGWVPKTHSTLWPA